MLANNNKFIISKLANNTLQTNKRQFTILFVSIALSAFMLFSIFTIGLTYLDLSRLQNTRLYGLEYDISIINGFTEKQKEILKNNSNVQTVGIQTYCGSVKSTDADDTVSVGMLWGDKTFWESQKSPAITEMNGHYPKAENELLATEETLKACGKDSLSTGDHFSMTYEDNTGIHTKEFVISGIWNGYGGDKTNFYVSKDFYNQSGHNLESDGVLQIKLKSNYIIKNTIEKLEESLDLSARQIFHLSDYIEKSLTILLAVCGLCFIICLSAYLIIYNILYLSVLGKIRYYGLLQTLGMTKKQLVQFIRKQMLVVGIAGITVGIMLGIFISMLLVPYVMKILGISLENIDFHFYLPILILSILTTGIAILSGIRTPIHIATNVTPLEAIKYRANIESTHTNKEAKGNLYWHMAKKYLKKDKRRTTIVFLSLAISLIVFYCLTTIIDSQGKRTVYPNYWDADFIVHNNTQTTEDISSLQQAISNKFISKVKKTDGIAEVHVVNGFPVTFPYDVNGFSNFWIKEYSELKPFLSYSKTVLDYQKNPEKYYGMIKGIDEAEFDYLNKSLGNKVNKQDFLNGKTAILQYAGFEIPKEWIGSTIPFSIGNQTLEIAIGAINYGDYYGTTVNFGANLIVSQKYIKVLDSEPYTLSLNIKYEQSYKEDTESQLKNLIEKSQYSKDLYYTSKFDEMKSIQDSQSGMFEIGTVIAILLLLVGMLNYINTMASSMLNRKLTFSIMESVGMSRRQIGKILIREGILYAGGSILITLTVGTGITYIVFQSMNYMKISFAIPVFPLLCAVLLVTIICIVTPIITYKIIIGNRTIIERLREYE